MADTKAQWIWYPTDPELVFFRRGFHPSKVPAVVRLRLTVDNDYVVFVNGHLVGADAGG